MMEALHRAEDALKAVKSAQEDGIISGRHRSSKCCHEGV